MASRDVREPPTGFSSEKTPYSIGTYHSRNDSQGLGISDDESERGLFPPSRPLSEKRSMTLDGADQSNVRNGNDSEPRRPWYRRFCCLIAAVLSLLIAIIILLCVLLVPLHQHGASVQAQWLNLTGFPPLPTGIATVVNPRTAKEVSGCMSPAQLWSCAAPAGNSGSGRQNTPNFRFEIKFRNHTVPSNETNVLLSNSTLSRRDSGHVARAGAIMKRNLWSGFVFSSTPAPPSKEDQSFLGKSTDRVSEPYEGEEPPFYISLLNASATVPEAATKLRRRDDKFRYPYPSSSSAGPHATRSSETTLKETTSQTSASATVTATPDDIPDPAVHGDGEPDDPLLYPFAYAQPLRLFNRGQDSEHYGFYTYFDRSIYISTSSNSILSSNSSSFGSSITKQCTADGRFSGVYVVADSLPCTDLDSEVRRDFIEQFSFNYCCYRELFSKRYDCARLLPVFGDDDS